MCEPQVLTSGKLKATPEYISGKPSQSQMPLSTGRGFSQVQNNVTQMAWPQPSALNPVKHQWNIVFQDYTEFIFEKQQKLNQYLSPIYISTNNVFKRITHSLSAFVFNF